MFEDLITQYHSLDFSISFKVMIIIDKDKQ